ncbi:1-acyl-sn-glycerol-3-phosphate acyltransferase [Aestuariirhabdus litorea]|uniref:Acyltransferase n=1 Tax=Aestuariirhabdus litorea TaxID=2528527 RepID=A0A3P3VJW8_9GAMM|nr:1-acyl-sn-glycerol-3-phosphate acyltransferase [Aestuariirhabdus litorea]RRJ82674.1 acyltransferase [Aestuariirhabdus litorea]RWW92834.1 acyltransferase [Endozoicomonadaceae bacterium GTF-13]
MSSNYYPRSPFAEWAGNTVLKTLGWRIDGELPTLPKYVAVVGYHTSNWDFVILIAAKLVMRLRARWFGKHSLFKWPLMGRLFRAWGGIAIKRHRSHGVVEQAVEAFDRHSHFVLGLSPEGTRSLTRGWKAGFYHIARGAQVPILPVALDFERKRIVVGEARMPAQTYRQELERQLRFYNQFPPRYPERAWRGEEEAPTSSQKRTLTGC